MHRDNSRSEKEKISKEAAEISALPKVSSLQTDQKKADSEVKKAETILATETKKEESQKAKLRDPSSRPRA